MTNNYLDILVLFGIIFCFFKCLIISLLADEVHYNEAGEKFIADRYYNCTTGYTAAIVYK